MPAPNLEEENDESCSLFFVDFAQIDNAKEETTPSHKTILNRFVRQSPSEQVRKDLLQRKYLAEQIHE